MSKRRTSAAHGGFTIVELLATLVLVGIVLPVAVHGIVLCLATAEHARQQAEAAALAQSKLAELVATDQWYDAELDGDFGEEWPEYRWAAQVLEWEDTRMVELDVCVFWTRRGQDRDVILSTLIYTGTPNETY